MVDQGSMGPDIGTKELRVGVLRHTRNVRSHGTQPHYRDRVTHET